ncbi:MAG: PD40 domain-containing protein [Deltaproteobacteria bacterium]|nr:PD40 domain-containing protein [Deltaproteobacteria bacterium]
MKKLSIFTYLILGLILSACGSSETQAPQENTNPEITEEVPPPIRAISFLAQGEAEEATQDLYVLLLDQSDNLLKVNNDLGPYNQVNYHSWSPDGTRLYYLSDDEIADINELKVYDPLQDQVIKMHPDLEDWQNIENTSWSPDGSKIAYLLDLEINGVKELYLADSRTGNIEKINPDLSYGREVDSYKWSEDGKKIAYLANPNNTNIKELYYYDLTNGTLHQVNPDFSGVIGNLKSVFSYYWSPDGKKIAYTADQDTENVIELYVYNLENQEIQKINQNLEGGKTIYNFLWSPDSKNLAYVADQDYAGVQELFLHQEGSSTAIKINPDFEEDSGKDIYNNLKWSEDSQNLFYNGDQDTEGLTETYFFNLTSDTFYKLEVGINSFYFSNNGKSIVYIYQADPMLSSDLYLLDLSSNQKTKINPDMVDPSNNVINFYLLPKDTSKIAYLADQDTNGFNELYLWNASDQSVTKISELPGPIPNRVYFAKWSYDGKKIAFSADPDEGDGINKGQLYVFDVDSQEVRRINQGLTETQTLNSDHYWWSPDNQELLYYINDSVDGTYYALIHDFDGELLNLNLFFQEKINLIGVSFSPFYQD